MPHDGFTSARARTEFLGLTFAPLRREAALHAIAARASLSGPFAYVIEAHSEHVVALDADPETRAPLHAGAWLTLNGSRLIEMLARIAGFDLPVTKSAAIAADLLASAIHPEEAVCVIGGDASLIAALAARYGLTNVHWRPVRDASQAESAAEFVAKTRARFTFFCEASPLAEMIARAAMNRGDAAGVGLCLAGVETFTNEKQPWHAGVTEALRHPARTWAGIARRARMLPIFQYWLFAQLSDRASISARNAF
ncbi:MAG: hypothetical protein AB7J28_06960 [Hyphomonadaceae bacterium]